MRRGTSQSGWVGDMKGETVINIFVEYCFGLLASIFVSLRGLAEVIVTIMEFNFS